MAEFHCPTHGVHWSALGCPECKAVARREEEHRRFVEREVHQARRKAADSHREARGEADYVEHEPMGPCPCCGQMFVERMRRKPADATKWVSVLAPYAREGVCPKCHNDYGVLQGFEKPWEAEEWLDALPTRLLEATTLVELDAIRDALPRIDALEPLLAARAAWIADHTKERATRQSASEIRAARLQVTLQPFSMSVERETDEEYVDTEEYEEEVIVRPAGIFRKALKEVVRRTRQVTRTRRVPTVTEERWCVATNDAVGEIERTLLGDAALPHALAAKIPSPPSAWKDGAFVQLMQWSACGSRLAVGMTGDHRLSIYGGEDFSLIERITLPGTPAGMSPDFRTVFVDSEADGDDCRLVYSIDSGTTVARLPSKGFGRDVAVSPDGSRTLSRSSRGTLLVDTASWDVLQSFDGDTYAGWADDGRFIRFHWSKDVGRVHFHSSSGDEYRAAVVVEGAKECRAAYGHGFFAVSDWGHGGSLQIRDVDTGHTLSNLRSPEQGEFPMGFSPCGNFLAFSDNYTDGPITVIPVGVRARRQGGDWIAENRTVVAGMGGRVSFSPDGWRMAVGGHADGDICVYRWPILVDAIGRG